MRHGRIFVIDPIFRKFGSERPDAHLADDIVTGEVEGWVFVTSGVSDVVRYGPHGVVTCILHYEAHPGCYTVGGKLKRTILVESGVIIGHRVGALDSDGIRRGVMGQLVLVQELEVVVGGGVCDGGDVGDIGDVGISGDVNGGGVAGVG